MAAWTYLIAALGSGVIIGELPLSGGVRMSKVLNGSGQLRAQTTLGDAKLAARNVYDMTRPARRVVYAVRDNRPWWGGIIWASDYDSDTRVLELGCADFWSYFDHRKMLPVLTLPAAPSYVAGLSTVYTGLDQNTIARSLVTLAQSHTGGDIGIVVDAALSGILRDRTYQGYDLVDVGEALRELAGVSNGPDVVFDVGTFDANGRPTRLMRTGMPKLGQQGSPHRFDAGGNLLSYRWSSAAGVMATRAFAEGDGEERGTLFAVAEDASRYGDGWPLLETDDVFADVTVPATLQQHADTLLAGGKLPVVTPELRVRAELAPTLGEVSVGDDAHMVIPAGDLLFSDGIELTVRILAIEVDIDDQGQETVKLICQSVQEVA